MKAGQPLRRNTPLRRTPFVTRPELPRTGTPKVREYSTNPVKLRSSRINPVSAKRMRQNRERRKVIAAKYPEPVICAVPWCTNVGNSPHEPLTRARGGSITDPDNIVMVCWPHNQELTMEPAWGYELGLLKHSEPTR